MTAERTAAAVAARPVAVDAFMDFQCPYSYRVVAWLDELGPERVTVRHHFFAIEQVNRDPAATEWRLWDQPLDYRHWRELPDRRPLLAFLAMAIVEATEPADVTQAFRLTLYMARFDFGKDISDLEVVEQAARMSGVAEGRIRTGLGDPAQEAAARGRIAADRALARGEFEIFGVPTLRLDGSRPVYTRLAGMVAPADAARLLETLVAVRDAAPEILELKAVEPAKPADGGSSAEGVKPAGPPDAGGRTVQGPTAQASALGASAPPASIDPARGTPGTA